MSSCFDGFQRAEQYSSLLRIKDLYRVNMVVSDLSSNTERTHAISFLDFSAVISKKQGVAHAEASFLGGREKQNGLVDVQWEKGVKK